MKLKGAVLQFRDVKKKRTQPPFWVDKLWQTTVDFRFISNFHLYLSADNYEYMYFIIDGTTQS